MYCQDCQVQYKSKISPGLPGTAWKDKQKNIRLFYIEGGGSEEPSTAQKYSVKRYSYCCKRLKLCSLWRKISRKTVFCIKNCMSTFVHASVKKYTQIFLCSEMKYMFVLLSLCLPYYFQFWLLVCSYDQFNLVVLCLTCSNPSLQSIILSIIIVNYLFYVVAFKWKKHQSCQN